MIRHEETVSPNHQHRSPSLSRSASERSPYHDARDIREEGRRVEASPSRSLRLAVSDLLAPSSSFSSTSTGANELRKATHQGRQHQLDEGTDEHKESASAHACNPSKDEVPRSRQPFTPSPSNESMRESSFAKKSDASSKDQNDSATSHDPGTAFQYTAFQQVLENRENIEYLLTIREQPKHSRMCGVGEKADRRPIDPSPVVQLRVISHDCPSPSEDMERKRALSRGAAEMDEEAGTKSFGAHVNAKTELGGTSDRGRDSRRSSDNSRHDEEASHPVGGFVVGAATPDSANAALPRQKGRNSYSNRSSAPGIRRGVPVKTDWGDGWEDKTWYLENPHYFMYATLADPDKDKELHLLPDGKTRYTTGSCVSCLYHLNDMDGSAQGFFVFPDLSIRVEGRYRLKLCLFETMGTSIQHCKSIYSTPFNVYTAKRFPGMEESTLLSKCFADQGLKVRVRKNPRARRARAAKRPTEPMMISEDESDAGGDASLAKRKRLSRMGPQATYRTASVRQMQHYQFPHEQGPQHQQVVPPHHAYEYQQQQQQQQQQHSDYIHSQYRDLPSHHGLQGGYPPSSPEERFIHPRSGAVDHHHQQARFSAANEHPSHAQHQLQHVQHEEQPRENAAYAESSRQRYWPGADESNSPKSIASSSYQNSANVSESNRAPMYADERNFARAGSGWPSSARGGENIRPSPFVVPQPPPRTPATELMYRREQTSTTDGYEEQQQRKRHASDPYARYATSAATSRVDVNSRASIGEAVTNGSHAYRPGLLYAQQPAHVAIDERAPSPSMSPSHGYKNMYGEQQQQQQRPPPGRYESRPSLSPSSGRQELPYPAHAPPRSLPPAVASGMITYSAEPNARHQDVATSERLSSDRILRPINPKDQEQLSQQQQQQQFYHDHRHQQPQQQRQRQHLRQHQTRQDGHSEPRGFEGRILPPLYRSLPNAVSSQSAQGSASSQTRRRSPDSNSGARMQ